MITAEPRKSARQPLWLESRLLLAACLVDLFLTLALIASGHAVEANPVLNAYLGLGIQWFLVVKAVLLGLIPVGLVEWLRERYPGAENRLRLVVRFGLVGYGLVYVGGVIAANT
jgi:hypothetical protein